MKTVITINKFDGTEWYEYKKIFGLCETKYKSSRISTVGNFSETETVIKTYWIPDINEFNNILISNQYYHILNIENVNHENKEMIIRCTKVELEKCNIKRLTIAKDEKGRPIKELQALNSYPGILTKKYMKYVIDIPNSNREEEFVFVFPSECDIKVADIIEVNGKNFIVKSSFSPVPFRLEVEASLKIDA